VPVAAPALADLLWIAVLLFAFAFVWTVRKLIAALFGSLIAVLQQVPGLGGPLGRLLFTIEQAVANALGSAEGAIDRLIGASWHFLARLTGELWHELEAHATLLLELATGFYPIVVAVRALRAGVHSLTATHGVTSARVKTLEREYKGIEHQVKAVERELRGIDDVGIRGRLKKVEGEVGAIESQAIPAIQQAESDADTAIGNLYDWIKGKASILGVGTFTTAVAAALGALGINWLKCPTFLNKTLGRGCGLWNGVEDMLGLFFDFFLFAAFCDLWVEATPIFEAILDPLVGFVATFADGACSHPPGSFASFTVTEGAVPPAQALGAIPS